MSRRRIQNDRLLRALALQPVDRPPVWLMRQAGRYLPEYRRLRERAGSFMALCSDPELACEVTMQPLRRYGLDAAILFSDILTIPDAMGLGLEFVAGEGPVFKRPLREASEIERLGVPDPEQDLGYVIDAVRTIRAELGSRLPLIGFAGSPWTLACYMLQGAGSREFARARAWIYRAPEALERLLETLAEAVAEYLHAQAAAGADALMVFDTWGGLLSAEQYRRLSLGSMRRVLERLAAGRHSAEHPVILFSKGCGDQLEAIAASGCAGVGVDWRLPLDIARERVQGRLALQGNLDPVALSAPAASIRRETRRVLDEYGPHPGHIFNLGHGITPDIDPESVAAMVATVQAYRY